MFKTKGGGGGQRLFEQCSKKLRIWCRVAPLSVVRLFLTRRYWIACMHDRWATLTMWTSCLTEWTWWGCPAGLAGWRPGQLAPALGDPFVVFQDSKVEPSPVGGMSWVSSRTWRRPPRASASSRRSPRSEDKGRKFSMLFKDKIIVWSTYWWKVCPIVCFNCWSVVRFRASWGKQLLWESSLY